MPTVQLVNLEIRLTRSAPELDGLRICHLSDLHTNHLGSLEQQTINLLKKIEADLFVFTGDLTSGSNELDAVLAVLTSIKTRLGSYVIYGNNDHNRAVDVDRTTRLLIRNGIQVLQNKSIHLSDPDFWLVGVDDPYLKLNDLDFALQGIPEETPKILLAHSPDILGHAIDRKIDLVLAGHTHGGQVCLPGGQPIWGHLRYGTKVAVGYFTPDRLREKGFQQVSHTHLFVTRGIGYSVFPIRLFCPPEVVVITLRSQ
jgi:predicted MPP superfamily phosphohydrolase